MCFTNEPDRLTKLRARKGALTVWKTVETDHKTGLCYSQYNGQHDRVCWKKGTVVHPHRIRAPIKGRRETGSGLYFYTSRPPEGRYRFTIIARVQPEDIIGVGFSGSQICVVAAKVINAPNPPDQTEMRIKYLNEKIQRACDTSKIERERREEWDKEEPEKEEALQQMLDEVEELKG